MKRIYQHLEHFNSLRESGEMDLSGIVTTPDGEDVYLADLLTGIDTLPPRQRQAFELICLKSYTESATTAIMLPGSKWTTPCQQYADAALDRMIAIYDEVQAGTWTKDKERQRTSRAIKGKANANPESNGGDPSIPVSGSGIADAEQAAAT